MPHPEDGAEIQGWAQGRTAAPSAVGLRKHMSRILRVWDTICSSQSAELCFTVHIGPFLGWKSWWRTLAGQFLHPPLLAGSSVSSGLFFFSACLLRGSGERLFSLPLCPLLSLFSPQSVLFLPIWFVFLLVAVSTSHLCLVCASERKDCIPRGTS